MIRSAAKRRKENGRTGVEVHQQRRIALSQRERLSSKFRKAHTPSGPALLARSSGADFCICLTFPLPLDYGSPNFPIRRTLKEAHRSAAILMLRKDPHLTSFGKGDDGASLLAISVASRVFDITFSTENRAQFSLQSTYLAVHIWDPTGRARHGLSASSNPTS